MFYGHRNRVAVVGAGMGGLVAALELARQGFDVTLLEKTPCAGGKLHQADVAGQRIDSGPTVLTMAWVFEEIFQRAGADFHERVELTPLQHLASHAWSDGTALDLYSDIERTAAAIHDFAGSREADGYRRFARRAGQVFELLDQPFMRRSCSGPLQLMQSVGLARIQKLWQIAPFKTLHSVLQEYFSDPRLLQLFGRYATYCGSSPYACPATLMLVTHAERCGVWSVAGGMVRLAEALAHLCIERGVSFRYDTEVSSVLTSGGRISGLLLGDGTTFSADLVVLNADAQALSDGCFGADVRHASVATARSQRSLSALTWSMVAKPEGRPLKRHNVFFFRRLPRGIRRFIQAPSSAATADGLHLCAGSGRDNAPTTWWGAAFLSRQRSCRRRLKAAVTRGD